jgi:hypothetical protein
VSFFDQPLRVTRFKLVHAVWRRQRMDLLPGVAPVSLVLARTENTVVGLTDVRGYPNGFAFLLRVRWSLVADPDEQPPWPFPDWGSPDPLDAEPLPDALLRFGVQFADGRTVTNLNMYPFVPEDLPPDQPVLVEGGGVGSEGGRLGHGAFWTWSWPCSPAATGAAGLRVCLAGTRHPREPGRGRRRAGPRRSRGRGAVLRLGGPAMRPRELAWPCPNVVPGMAPVAAILARTDHTVVAVTGIRAYPTGLGFTLNLRLRSLHPREQRGFWPFPELGRHRGPPWSGEVLRLTIEFADGRSVNNLDAAPSDPGVPAFEQPMLSSGPGTGLLGSGSSSDRWGWDMDYRVRPLPPPGPLAFVCVWPERGVPPSRLEVDGAAVLGAAEAAVTLWDNDPYCSAD